MRKRLGKEFFSFFEGGVPRVLSENGLLRAREQGEPEISEGERDRCCVQTVREAQGTAGEERKGMDEVAAEEEQPGRGTCRNFKDPLIDQTVKTLFSPDPILIRLSCSHTSLIDIYSSYTIFLDRFCIDECRGRLAHILYRPFRCFHYFTTWIFIDQFAEYCYCTYAVTEHFSIDKPDHV